MTGVGVVALATEVATAITAVAGMYFAFHEHRRRRAAGRGDDGGGAAEPPVPPARQGPYEVFVSYADRDADAAELLARRLGEADLAVFLMRWVELGQVRLQETERALTEAGLGVLLFGSGTSDDRRALDEYAAQLERKHQGALRFVPARTADVPLPPFAAIHQSLDLTRPGTAHYDREVARLVRIIRGQRRTAGA